MNNQSGNILFIDDDDIIREVIPRLIGKLGYGVDTASGVEESVEKYREAFRTDGSYDVVIVDLFLGAGVGGVTAARRILDIDPRASIIASSGDSQHKVMKNYRKYGFSDVIVKPYTAAELGEKLGEFVKPRG